MSKIDREKKRLIIDLTFLDKAKKYSVPDALKAWKDTSEVSEEYKDMAEELQILCAYIAHRLNEGPEVSASHVKKCATLKSVLENIILQTFIDGYHRYGVLLEVILNVYMKISGKMRTIQLLKEIQLAKKELMKEKFGDYVQ